MKRILALVLAVLMIFSTFVACEAKDESENGQNQSQNDGKMDVTEKNTHGTTTESVDVTDKGTEIEEETETEIDIDAETEIGGSDETEIGGSDETEISGSETETGGSESETGDSESEIGGSETGNSGSETGNGGSETGNGGSETGNGGSETGNSGSETGNGGSETGNGGSETGNGGSETGNENNDEDDIPEGDEGDNGTTAECAHTDADLNHKCDSCGTPMGEHADKEKDRDHKCDYCGVYIGSCIDSNYDHKCDECGAPVGEHSDEEKDGDHRCEYCGYSIGSCIDSDKNHKCDECEGNVGEHADKENDGNHKCEYCKEVAGSCVDSDKNHVCDECGASVGEHADAENDGDHKCEYCEATISACTNSNEDHECDECGASPIHNFQDRVCVVCGYEAQYDRDGYKITFGSYPQTLVTDATLISTLNSKAGTLPTETDSQDWTSYGYYSRGKVQDYMWFIDVEDSGEKYRGVYFIYNRPGDPINNSASGSGAQKKNGYDVKTVYWFKYEPISWTIISEDSTDGTALLFCDMVIDSQRFDYDGTPSSSYVYSNIRAWLNETFYYTAFDKLQKQIIVSSMVDNSVESTGASSNVYAGNDTQDYVFLLSYKDATNTNYRFPSSGSTVDIVRQKKATDYASVQGGTVEASGDYSGNATWLLRSPAGGSYANYVRGVHCAGSISSYVFNYSISGVVPALRIKLNAPIPDTEEKVYERDGQKIIFGSYPQTKVTDVALIETLNSAAGTLPTLDDSQDWTSYGYYTDSSKNDFMWYIDIEEGGEKYRGVYFTSYRASTPTQKYGNQSTNNYSINIVYWFKYEPISWRILEEDTTNGKALILCDMVIDSQQFDYEDDSYSSNYADSTIRAWLNDTFYNTAFDELQKQIIVITTVDNSEESVGMGDNDNVCEDTQDYVFLLSNKDVTNVNYGLTTNTQRKKTATDYAMAQGVECLRNGSCWLLRSPHVNSSDRVYAISNQGGSSSYENVYSTDSGIVPALTIKL